MTRALALLAIVSLAAALARAQEQSLPVEASEAMEPVPAAGVCAPPFAGSACPPPPGDPECRAREHAQSRDGAVRAELVEDGRPLDLVAVHLVVHTPSGSFSRRHVGERGVACGTFEMSSSSFTVDELAVRNALFGRAPEVILRAHHASGPDSLIVCSTDVSPPRCLARPSERAVRFQRPDTIRVGTYSFRMDLGVP